MNRRILSLTLACALSLSVLSACGSSDKGAGSASSALSADPGQSSASASVPEVSVPDASAPDVSQPDGSAPDQPSLDSKVEVTLTLNKSDFTLKSPGASYKLKYTCEPMLHGPAAQFASSDESVASVAEDGTVTAVAPGKAAITLTYGDLTAQCIVRCVWEEKTEDEQPGSSASASSTPEAAKVDLEAFVADLAAQHGENFAANANVVEFGMHDDLYPGISSIATKQLVIYQPMMGAVVCEIALAEVTSASDVDAVKAVFQARIDAQVAGGAWYPESIQGWQNNSRIVSNGNCVLMVAFSECDAIVEQFNAL